MALRLVSFLGLFSFLFIAWLASERRRAFPLRTVVTGLGLQFLFALIVLRTGPGRQVIEAVRRGFIAIVDSSRAGGEFVFGALMPAIGAPPVLGITIICTIILVSSLMAVLYHWGVMQRVVYAMAWVMRRVMRVSGRESLVAAANVFLGMTEAPLFIRPYLNSLSRSEMLALMVTGLATMAGGVMAVYVGWGVNAGHLLTASVMSAPAALTIAKIMCPPDAQPDETRGALSKPELHTHAANVFEAVTRGARDGLHLSLNVLAMLVAIISLLSLLNLGIGWLGGLCGIEGLSLQQMLGWICQPLARIMGVPAADSRIVGELLGKQIFLTEFVAYRSLAESAAQ
ncbi:Na+ dependent nucleoside transporter domain protein, partial [bacterium]|nr:Na+ dependent nucleoside transporter domain protein [bacterium]